jgi:xanthine dehydrogenase YagS FAD-binding subunit
MSTATMQALTPEFRAAGTDLSERRRSGVSKGPLIDIASTGDSAISWGADGAATIGAFATIAAIAADDRLATAYPGIAASAQGLATPQVRHLYARRQPRAAFALLVFPESAFRLPEERRQRLPCAYGQSSLRRRLRSRPLRRAASFDHGGGAISL